MARNSLRVIVHDLDQARAAVAAAAGAAVPVVLFSPPDAGGYWGAGYFQALIAGARGSYPDVRLTGVLDCGADAGWALAALRAGVDAVRFTGHPAARERLAHIAARQGRRLWNGPMKALDLGAEEDVWAACANYLRDE